MPHKISIIMPCYNCSSTLEEAVASIYEQNFTTPYEVVLVNDGSTDDTEEAIRQLAKKYQNISYYNHNKNKGGGAARNTAVSKTSGDIIFCLDSDDILPPQMIQKMFNFLLENECDGVLFEETKFFSGKKIKKTATSFNKTKTDIKISDLFDNKQNLLTQVNFMYTKKSFNDTGGYPEHHGFDTQGFGHKYLSKGHKVMVCPNTYYYHRQGNKKSYFERVYESGDFSKNFYYIYEDIIHLFSNKSVKKIINFDIFQNSAMGGGNIAAVLIGYFTKYPNEFFIKDKEKYLTPDGFEKYNADNSESKSIENIFKKAVYFYKRREYQSSFDLYRQILESGHESKILYFNIIRCLIAINGKHDFNNIEKDAGILIESLLPKKQNINLIKPNLAKKIINKLFS